MRLHGEGGGQLEKGLEWGTGREWDRVQVVGSLNTPWGHEPSEKAGPVWLWPPGVLVRRQDTQKAADIPDALWSPLPLPSVHTETDINWRKERRITFAGFAGQRLHTQCTAELIFRQIKINQKTKPF